MRLRMSRPDLGGIQLTRRAALVGAGVGLASCAAGLGRPVIENSSSPWDAAAGAFEHGDSARTSVFASVDPFARAGPRPTAELAPFPTPGLWSVAFDRRGVGYALHGVLGGAGEADRPHLSAFDPESLEEIWRIALPLPAGRNWIYPGGIGVLSNGHLYAIYTTRIVRVDPLTGAIVASADLPAPAGPEHTAYNGFIALSDGRLLAKSHHRKADCPHGGYRALIECGVEGLPNSALVLLDRDRLETIWRGDAPEFVGGRVSAVKCDGREFVYLAGATSVHRLAYHDDALHADSRWSAVRYVGDGETPGTAVVGFGEFVIVQNNAVPARSPLRLTLISQRDPSDRIDLAPFKDTFDGYSFMPSKPSADATNRMIYASEAHGALAAIRLDRREGLRIDWTAPVKTGSFITVLGPASSRTLVASDIGAAPYDPRGAPVHQRERVVWLDAGAGMVLSQIGDLPRNFGLTLTPYADGSIFCATRNGGLWRLRPSRDAEDNR